MKPSPDHSNWVTVGEVINLVKRPVAAYADHIVKTFHAKLCQDCQPFGLCTDAKICPSEKKPNDLCHSCNGWYQKLATSHRNGNKSQIKWRQNCDTSKWSVDPWEVAKFFMSALGDNKSHVKNAESTDLSSLLNVLEWMKDVAFGGCRRVDLNLVKDLRSKVRNAWAHAPNQEMTDAVLNQAFEIANKFLADLDKVFTDEEVKRCAKEVQLLQTNGLTNVIETDLKNLVVLRRELGGDVNQMKEEIRHLKQDQNSDSLVIHENEKKLKNLEYFSEECCSRMEDFQKWKKNTEQNSADIKELQDAKNVRDNELLDQTSRLPERLSTFTGREKEIKAIKSSLVEKNNGIVSIIGGQGFGKSTIAVEVSHRLSEEDKIPVIFSYLSTASTMPEAVRHLCIDVGIEAGKDLKSSLMVWLRNMKPRKVVLVLDNIEQLLEGEVKSHFLGLLRFLRKDSNQHLRVMTTSRKSFNVSDLENECFFVETMDTESSKELLRKCCPEKDLQCDDLKEMANLCGHVPLALRLLAFHLKDTDPVKLVE